MKTIISNLIKVYDASPSLREWSRINLVVTNPKYSTLIRLGKQDQIQRYHISKDMYLYSQIGNDLILPFGVLPAIWKFIKDCPYELNFNDHGRVMNSNFKITQPLFEYQDKALQSLLKAKMGVLVAPCSAGKTNIMSALIHSLGRRFLFLVHTSDLLKQFYSRIKSLYPYLDIGVITDGKVQIGKHGAVATIQTMDIINPEIYKNEFDVVICDECAHVAGSPTLSKMFVRVISNIKARYVYGCTATPSRSDGMIKSMYTTLGLNPDGEFAPVYAIEKSETRSLTADHIKLECNVPFDYRCLNADGTFNFNELLNVLSENPERNELIINSIIEQLNNGRRVLVLCHRIEQCELLHNRLIKLGKKSALLIGKVSSKKREAILTEKESWEVIIGTYSLAKEGLDVPSLDCLFMCTPIADKGMTIQCVGRIERYKENKPAPIVFDVCDINYPYCVGKWKKRDNYLKRRF